MKTWWTATVEIWEVHFKRKKLECVITCVEVVMIACSFHDTVILPSPVITRSLKGQDTFCNRYLQTHFNSTRSQSHCHCFQNKTHCLQSFYWKLCFVDESTKVLNFKLVSKVKKSVKSVETWNNGVQKQMTWIMIVEQSVWFTSNPWLHLSAVS